jgi:hypothetical protein
MAGWKLIGILILGKGPEDDSDIGMGTLVIY